MLPQPEMSTTDTEPGPAALGQPSVVCSTTLSAGSVSAGGGVPSFGSGLTSSLDKHEDRNHLLDIAKQYAKGPKHTLDSLRADREMMFRVVREHKDGWRLLKHASPELRADRELLLAAVKSTNAGWKALLGAPLELREDRELGMEAVRRNAAALEMLSPRLRRDATLVSEALGAFSKRMQPSRRGTAALEWKRGAQNRRERSDGRQKRAATAEAMVYSDEAFLAERLQAELEDGVGELHTNEEGTQVCLLQVVALRICNPQGLVLAVIGRYDGHVLKPKCTLPGQRIPSGCQPREIASRFLETRLAGLQRWLDVDTDFDLISKDSDHGSSVTTQYRKATFNVVAHPGIPWHKVARRVQQRARCSNPHVTMMRQTLGKRFLVSPGTLAPKPPDMYTLLPQATRFQPVEMPDVVDVYAWIPAWEFEWLQSSKLGQEALDEWLCGLDVAAHLAANGRAMSPSRSESPRSPRSPLSPSRTSGGRCSSAARPMTSQSQAATTDAGLGSSTISAAALRSAEEAALASGGAPQSARSQTPGRSAATGAATSAGMLPAVSSRPSSRSGRSAIAVSPAASRPASALRPRR
mmetsp:Transcript_12299/g.35366  ORF Transcript_12299/g.35366 Transcript_12299/m.35366 type:complete len:581 (-) Transcript_12299:177-1919(-)